MIHGGTLDGGEYGYDLDVDNVIKESGPYEEGHDVLCDE